MDQQQWKLLPTLLLLFLLPFSGGAASNSTTCPFNLTAVSLFVPSSPDPDKSDRCQFALSAIHLLQSDLLRRTSLFLVPAISAASCWSLLAPLFQFDPRSDCGFPNSSLSEGCMNISTRTGFESQVDAAVLSDLRSRCNASLENGSPCADCTTHLTSVKASYLNGTEPSNNVSDCNAYPSIYTAAVLNQYGPSDPGTADCLFFLNLAGSSSSSRPAGWVFAVAGCSAFVLVVLLVAGRCFLKKRKRRRRERKKMERTGSSSTATMVTPTAEAIAGLARYTLEEMQEATAGFSRDNLIGRGGYGNVYRGVLPDGAEIAVKRFKNCAAAGDASFAHEVEVIASVRHVNLVALRGYCIAPVGDDGRHQRMIVCDLMRNGSLHDHLFGVEEGRARLTWPARRRIALGAARGLAYLHHGAQPRIIHRDIKASNVLLDDEMEAKLADFGLAKFAPEGFSHFSTRVAGTMGYVAPEYALYGKLSEKSDVYSFGILLLELFSGRRAVVTSNDGQPWLLTDWAWSLVREDRAMEVVERGVEDLDPAVAVEKFVLVAVLCSHPVVQARPTMDQVMKMLETDTAVPPIPDRPPSIIADLGDIEPSAGSSWSGQVTTLSGYRPVSAASDRSSSRDQLP